MSVVALQELRSSAERYRQTFEARWQSSDALTTLRRAALDRFVAAGFPTPRDEDWKYTNLRRLEARSFTPADKSVLALGAPDNRWIASAGTRIVLVNGHCLPALSSSGVQPPGTTLLTLRQWLDHDPEEVAAFLEQSAASQPSALEDLNLAFFEDGVVLNLAAGAHPDEPIYVVHQWNDAAAGRMSNPRLIVKAGPNSRCVVIEHFIGPAGAGEYFTNAVATIEIAAGATVEHYRIQQESVRGFHLAHVKAQLQIDSRYAVHDVALGGSLARTSIAAALAGSGSHASLQGLLAPLGTQHLDAHTRIDHIAPNTSSDESYRGIAGERGRGVFNGKVIVRPGAQQTDARQSSRNLLLSPGAEIDTKPELEIYANDVKCSHGAATGRLDAAALFYLRSRGLSEGEARRLLIRAFAESIVAAIGSAPVRAHLEKLLDERYSIEPDSAELGARS